MLVGVLALQGDFQAHGEVLRRLGVTVREVRTSEQLRDVAAVVLPGGESTTMRKLMEGTGLEEALADGVLRGRPILATCAGAILLAKGLQNPEGRGIGLLDADVIRNAYGRQLESKIVRLDSVREDLLGQGAMEGVFIRAPRLVSLGEGVEVLASRGADPVLVRQGKILAATFHPELTQDDRVHRFFLESCEEAVNRRGGNRQDGENSPEANENGDTKAHEKPVTHGTHGKRGR
jgi:pyridoxal 5'-phosphate synthase pdxT subunit